MHAYIQPQEPRDQQQLVTCKLLADWPSSFKDVSSYHHLYCQCEEFWEMTSHHLACLLSIKLNYNALLFLFLLYVITAHTVP